MTTEEENKIIELYKELNSTKKVAENVGYSRPTVSSVLKKHGILNRMQQNNTEELAKQIVHAYTVELLNTNQIKEKFHIGKPKIKEILQSHGIEFRKERNLSKDILNKRKEDFIKKAKEKHKNENLDYSKVEYVNNRTPVCIIDNDLDETGTPYGEYWQTPSMHLMGGSHPRKRSKKISSTLALTKDEFIARAKQVHHNENLDYSKVVYVNLHTKVCIIDHDLDPNGNKYGEYWQEPSAHLKGCGFPNKKKNVKSNLKTLLTIPETTISNNKTIKNNIIQEIKENIKCVKSLKDDKLDILFVNKHIGVKIHDLMYEGEWKYGTCKDQNLNITETSNEEGISVIHLFSDEWVQNKQLVINKLKHIAGLSSNKPTIMARKCTVKEITYKEACDFLDINHIQMSTSATLYLGAFHNDSLIAVMTFKKEGYDKWDLNRFASDNNYKCSGIGGKLFKHFVKNYDPIEVKSFADKRWTINYENNLYIKLGFSLVEHLRPNYTYINSDLYPHMRFHKFGFRKELLHKKYGLPLEMTETEMVKEVGFDRIWDCGLLKYLWVNEEKRKNTPRRNGEKITQEEFQKLLKEKFNGKITCDEQYINAKTDLKFYCHEKNDDGSDHGIFYKHPYQLLRLHRHCPICMGNRKPQGFWKKKENCEEFAKTCKNKYELQKKFTTCYTECRKNGWLDEFQEKYFDGKTHYRNPEDPVHCVYAYLFDDTKTCYVGRTSNIKRRHKQHKLGWFNSKHEKCVDNLYKYCQEHSIEMPNPIVLEEHLIAPESQIREEYWLNFHINDGWKPLNKASVGLNKSSLGATLKWTYEKCKEEASKYTSKQKFREGNQSAHNAARREGWINEFFPVNMKLPDGYWNVLENCQKEALKYKTPKELRKNAGGCYNSILKHKWQNCIKYMES